MGNDLKQKVSDEIYQMEIYIGSGLYDKSKEIFQKIKLEFNQIQNENDINELINYLLETHTQQKDDYEFQAIISYLRPKDKLIYLIHLIYENKLIESIDKDQENINIDTKIIKKVKNDKNDFEKIKKDINNQMKKIYIINNYIGFVYFKSIMYEKISEKYFNLGTIMYTNFGTKQKQLSRDLQEIIDIFSECINNYNKTKNQKVKLEEYKNALERVTSHQNILLGKELIKEEKFKEALECFNKVNFNNSEMIEEKDKGTYLCYEKLAQMEEEKENYHDAIKFYEHIDNQNKIYELNIKINEIDIIKCIKKSQFDATFIYFKKIFELVSKAKNREFVELKFSKIFEIFIDLIVKLAIISYQNKSLLNYIKTLEQFKNIIENEGISSEVNDLLSELNNLLKSNENLYLEYLTKSISSNNVEIKQRFYLSFLVIKYLLINPLEVLTILLKKGIKLLYLNTDSCDILKNYLKEKNNLNDLFLISKLFYKIIVNFGQFQKIEMLNALGNKILDIIKIPNIEKDNKYNDVIEYLFLSFQEITINNIRINKYVGPKKIFCSLLLKSNQFVSKAAKGLLFLSNNEMNFDKNIIDIIISYLIEHENDDLLETLFIQCQLQTNIIPDHLDSIYKILFNYHKLKIKNKNEKIEKIFNFLLSLSEVLISSNISVQNLEKYITEMEINPLCYELIEKIPIKYRGIKLAQKLAFYNEKKNQNQLDMDNDDKKSQFLFMSTISKDDLPELENNLDDPFYVEKLMGYLKNQKYLFQYLNIIEISRHFSSSTKELFILLTDNEVKFNEEALTHLLKGFYTNSDQEIKMTFDIFDNIKKYQPKLPSAIETNLKVEEFLYKKLYNKFQMFDIQLNDIFNDFSYLNGFANHHQQFILYFFNLSEQNKKIEILKKMKIFLLEKHYDIGVQIYKKLIINISSTEFIEYIKIIFPTKKISKQIKEATKTKLYEILVRTNNKLNLLKSFKYFIDFIELPSKILEYLVSILQYEISPEMYKEIMFILGIYFSTTKKDDEYFSIIIAITSQKELYQYIINNIKSIKDNKEILYLYGCLNYLNFKPSSNNENQVLQLPVHLVVSIINSLNNKLDKKLIYENINYFNKFYNYVVFSPRRDKILRKLFFNHKNNSPNQLKLICC